MNGLFSGTRAKRFPIQASVRYRAADAPDWHDGQTENMSCSGALIVGRHRIAPAAPVEVVLPLPSEIAGRALVEVLCRGRVIRVTPSPLPLLRPKFAVRWREVRVLNGEAKPPHKSVAQDNWQALVHDMYNEIAVIVGSSELLLDAGDEQRRQRVAAIRQACGHTVSLLDRLSALLGKSPRGG